MRRLDPELMSLICVIVGFFTVLCAGFNWDFFMNNATRKGGGIMKLFGISEDRQKQRILYIVLGIILFGVGIYVKIIDTYFFY